MSEKKLYPVVESEPPAPPSAPPSAPTFDTSVQRFRLDEIRKVRSELEWDLQKYNRCKRRYSSVYNILNHVNSGLGVFSVAEAAVSVGLLATAVFPVGALALACTAGACSAGSVLLTVISKRMSKKLDKHESISSLARAKLGSMNLIISKALEDSQISDQEFIMVQRDFQEYKTLKQDIQTKAKLGPTNLEDIKKKFVEHGRQLERKELTHKLFEPTTTSTNSP